MFGAEHSRPRGSKNGFASRYGLREKRAGWHLTAGKLADLALGDSRQVAEAERVEGPADAGEEPGLQPALN